MATQTSSSFVSNLGRIYGTYTGAFIGVTIQLAAIVGQLPGRTPPDDQKGQRDC